MISLPKPNSDVCFMCGEPRRQYYAYYNGIKFYVCYDGSCGERNQKLFLYLWGKYKDRKRLTPEKIPYIEAQAGEALVAIKNGLNLLLCL